MSMISSRLALTQRCTIERNTAAPAGWGDPAAEKDWQPHLEDLPCRHWVNAGHEIIADATTTTVVEDARLIVSLGTDVTEDDRVAEITERGGPVQATPLGIRAVMYRKDHLELVLVKVD